MIFFKILLKIFSGTNLVPKSAVDEDEALLNSTSSRRRILKPAILDEDEKYGGERVDRSKFFESNSEMTGLADGGSDNAKSDSENEDEEGLESDSDEDSESGQEEIEDGTESDGNEDENDEDLSMEGEEDFESGSEQNSGDEQDIDERQVEKKEESSKIQMTSNPDQEKEQKKAKSVQEQQRIWEQLLYSNIKNHSLLKFANQLPRGQLEQDLRKQATPSAKENSKKLIKNLNALVAVLMECQEELLDGAAMTKSCLDKGTVQDSDDEEIPSSDDENDDVDEEGASEDDEGDYGSDEEGEESDEAEKPQNSGKKVAESEKKLTEIDEAIDKLRKSTLSKWHSRTKMITAKSSTKDFSVFEGEIHKQLDNILSDKGRLLKKTQTKKCEGDRIGADPEADQDVEIFDDTDFYQILLKEFIEKKTSNSSNDAVAMSRNFIDMKELQARRSKKKHYEYAASKDKRIKYVPIPKLISFHPAQPEQVEWTHESRNELFKSLFT
ncbi:hypothetical protein WR25_09310 isoform C [Diploscapter pachys]|uniref:Protein AATF n=2 Tax=Diploscapter pachys TaxID=2018661 RepID=A0A2A2L4X9_9BILA|nr:hypothetical protein WR25_09310 isoform C [Diploscapter pachys]